MKNRIFDVDDEPVHPTARAWIERIQQGQEATLTLWRKRDGLTFKPAKIYISFETPRGKQRDHDDWDVDLNEALVREGVRAESPSNEAQRLSLMFRYWFSKPEERFGPGFFESVLVEVVKASEIADKEPLRDILVRVSVYAPSRDGYAYGDCREAIDTVLKKAARSLTLHLKYTPNEAKAILAEALAQYFDERFHITERRLLGWS